MWREFAAAGSERHCDLPPMSIVSSDRRHQGFDGDLIDGSEEGPAHALPKPHSNAAFTATKLEA
jgi:hypothetical protein